MADLLLVFQGMLCVLKDALAWVGVPEGKGKGKGKVKFCPITPKPLGLVNWGLSSFTAVLGHSGTVTATATHATNTHT